MDKLKIAFAFWDIGGTGGAQRVIGLVANALCDKYDVHIINLYGYPEDRGPSIPLDPKITVTYLGRGELPRLRKATTESFNPLRKYLRKHRINVCLVQTTYMGIISAPVALWNRFFGGKHRTHFVFHDHGALAAQLHDKSITGIRWLSAKIADRVIVLTRQSASDYTEKLRISPKKIRLITNWIDPAINPASVQADLQSQRIVWAGRLSQEKGALRIPEIARRILPDFPEWTWHIYGDGSQREELEALISQYGLEKQVILEGNSDHLYEDLPKNAIGTLTSGMEGMPMFLLETAAFRMPCVSFDVTTGPNEIIDNGETGYLVKPFDIDEYANKLRLLMESEERRKAFSQAQYRILDKFSMKKIAKLWDSFFMEFKDGHRGVRS